MIRIILKLVNITHKRNPMENLCFQNFARRTKFFTTEKADEKSAKNHVVLAKEVTTMALKIGPIKNEIKSSISIILFLFLNYIFYHILNKF